MDETVEPAADPQPPRDDQATLDACRAKLREVLAEYGCRIVPYLTRPEPVGTDGSRMIIGADYGVALESSE